MTGQALLPLLVTDNDEGPAVLVKRHRSGYSCHLDELARSGLISSLRNDQSFQLQRFLR